MIEQKTRTLLLLDILTIYDAFTWIVMDVGCRSVEMSCLHQYVSIILVVSLKFYYSFSSWPDYQSPVNIIANLVSGLKGG